MSALSRVVAALEERDCRPRGSDERGYSALCPSHDDRSPSLSVSYRNSKVLLRCHAGCTTVAVLDALALPWESLFDEEAHAHR